MTTIRTFTNQVQAAISATFLQDKNIDAMLLDQNSGIYIGIPIAVPIRMQVQDEQVEEARRWLTEFDATPVLPPDSAE